MLGQANAADTDLTITALPEENWFEAAQGNFYMDV